MNINFLEFNFDTSISKIFDFHYHFNFIFNSLEGKTIANFKQFCKKIKFNILFLSYLPKKVFNFFIKKQRFEYSSLMFNLIFLRDISKKHQKFLYKKIRFFTKSLIKLFFIYFKSHIINTKSLRLKFKKYYKLFFDIKKLKLPISRSNYLNLDIDKALDYVEFIRGLEHDPSYIIRTRLLCVDFNKKSRKLILYKVKKEIINNNFRKFKFSNLKLIKIILKLFKILKLCDKKMLLAYSILNIYTNGLFFGFFLNNRKNILEAIEEKELARKIAIRKALLNEQRRIYLKNRALYLAKVARHMQYINVYTMEYFNTTVIEKPELLQT
jgi:hypothetical protein